MANTLTITREHLDKDNYYIGPDVTNYDGDIVLEADLGVVRFKNGISASGSIRAEHGTGITTSEHIYAGESIKVAWRIEAGTSIEASWRVVAGGSIVASKNIKAGEHIESDWYIEAGCDIKAGRGIRAGFFIDCKTLSAEFPIFAGTATWIRPSKGDTQIRCKKLHGTVAYGELVLKTEKPTRYELEPCPICGAGVKIEQHFAAPFFNIECTCGLAMTGVLIGDQSEPPVYWVSDDKEEDVHSTKGGTIVAIFSHYENMPENYRQAFDSLVKKWNQRWLK